MTGRMTQDRRLGSEGWMAGGVAFRWTRCAGGRETGPGAIPRGGLVEAPRPVQAFAFSTPLPDHT